MRVALGAQSAAIVQMVVRQGILLAAVGIVPGIALAYAAGHAMRALLAGVQPGDAATFLAAVAVPVDDYLRRPAIPALRAVRVDPLPRFARSNRAHSPSVHLGYATIIRRAMAQPQ